MRFTRPSSDSTDSPGLQFFRTWRAVYGFVLFLFATYIVLLIVLERMFS